MIAEFGVLPWDTERERGGTGEEERAEKTKEKGELMWRNQALLEEVVRQAGRQGGLSGSSLHSDRRGEHVDSRQILFSG